MFFSSLTSANAPLPSKRRMTFGALVILILILGFLLIILNSLEPLKKLFSAVQTPPADVVTEKPIQPSTASGTVKRVESDQVTFEIATITTNMGIKNVSMEQTVTVNDKTRILLMTKKSDAAIKREQDAFSVALRNWNPTDIPPKAPTTFTERAASMNDITIGDSITVNIEGGDILSSTSPLVAAQLYITHQESNETR